MSDDIITMGAPWRASWEYEPRMVGELEPGDLFITHEDPTELLAVVANVGRTEGEIECAEGMYQVRIEYLVITGYDSGSIREWDAQSNEPAYLATFHMHPVVDPETQNTPEIDFVGPAF